MPISLIVADGDEACTALKAEKLAGELSTLQSHVLIENWDHNHFYWNSHPEYVDLLLKEVLAEPGTEFTGMQTM